MSRRFVRVQVVKGDGTARTGARVSLEVHQFAASGFVGETKTSSSGVADFDFSADSDAKLSVYVDGQKRVSHEAIKAEYRIIG